MVSRNLVYFCFLCERVSRFFDSHVIDFFWQILKYFLDFKTKKNKFFVKISVGFRCSYPRFVTFYINFIIDDSISWNFPLSHHLREQCIKIDNQKLSFSHHKSFIFVAWLEGCWPHRTRILYHDRSGPTSPIFTIGGIYKLKKSQTARWRLKQQYQTILFMLVKLLSKKDSLLKVCLL